MSDHVSNQTIPRSLALRLLTPAFWSDADPQQMQLLVGQAPDAWPADIPLPDHSRIVGSLMRNPRMIEVVIDSDLDPAAVLQFYRDRLGATGWTAPHTRRHTGGFMHGYNRPRQAALFCRSKRGPSLEVSAARAKDESTDVRLHLLTDPQHSPCGQMDHARDTFELIPMLLPPTGSHQQGGGGGGGSDRVYSSATLESDLDLPTIMAHYVEQLTAADWTTVAQGIDGPMAWSTWTWQDQEGEPWQGLFFVMQWGAANNYFMEIHLRSADAGGELAGPIGQIVSFG